MRTVKMFLFLTLALVLPPMLYAGNTSVTDFSTSRFGGQPLYFTENRGQWDERVLFKADGAGGLTWWIERDGFTLLYSVPDSQLDSQLDSQQMKRMKRMGYEPDPFDDLSASSASSAEKYLSHSLKFKFQHTLPVNRFIPDRTSPATAQAVEPTDRLSWNNNYFIGNDHSKWAPDCGNFRSVTLKNVWDGIDVVWRGTGKHVEFDFAIQPNADVAQISVACLGLTGDLETRPIHFYYTGTSQWKTES